MDEKNQILDVTYGNFSCRLEGFEDSVATMKTVVSFFHELAGHDRFMDVAPQAPDMETLARLTEEQTGQPVDVEGEGNSVSLRVRQDTAEEEADLSQGEDVEADEPFEEELAAQEPAEAEATEESVEEDTSVADKLQRIRAVVDRGPEDTDDDYAEDLSDSIPAVPPANPLTQRLAELARRNSDLAAQEEAEAADDTPEMYEVGLAEDPADADDFDAADAFAAEMDEQAQDDTPEDDAVAAIAPEDENVFAAGDDQAGDEPQVPSDGEMTADDLTAEEDTYLEEEADAEEDALLEEDAYAEDDALLEDVAELDEEALEEDALKETAIDDDDDDASELAPLVLTSRDAAVDDDAPEEASGEDDAYDSDDDDYDDDDDDDFDLQKEVAKVEAEIAARQGNELARHGLPRSVEDAMSRIMSQTDQHLNQPESRRHRDAFAQLKAAVAATEAARQLGDKGAESRDPDEVFKDDLGAHEAEERKAERSIPPLKLVKSQEVKPEAEDEEPAPDVAEHDRPEEPAAEAPAPAAGKPLDAASERLRQIAARKEAEQIDSSSGFAEFAAAHGATDLVDKLEAAGAYICFVEGEADFSRPQVMKVVQSASDEEITREDGLRCFGRLLRQARLIKLANGRFQVAENTQYRPDGDKAAQG